MSEKDANNATQEASENQAKAEPSAEVKKELTVEEKLAELNDKYLRLYADFENFRKRNSKERVDLIKYAAEEVFRQVLPVLDDMERAFKSVNEKTDLSSFKQGQELVYNKFKNILTQNGLQEMKCAGQPFDPDVHEAVTNIPAPAEDQKGKVVEEIERGYLLNGKVIRHAKVVVGN